MYRLLVDISYYIFHRFLSADLYTSADMCVVQQTALFIHVLYPSIGQYPSSHITVGGEK